MADTLDDIVRRVHHRLPLASPLLCQDLVQQGYESICRHRNWSWARAENQFLISASRTGTVDLTNASATVVGNGLTFAAADLYRQLQVTGRPYTIIDVDLANDVCTLDLPYGGTTATGVSITILDAYVRTPDDFASFIGVLDTARNRPLSWWRTEDEINYLDPDRSRAGDPLGLFSRRVSSVVDGVYEFELWPYQLNAMQLPYFYYKAPEKLSIDAALRGALRHNTYILVLAALEEATLWPGPSQDKPNPYFNQNLSRLKTDRLEAQLMDLETRDEEAYLTWLETVPWMATTMNEPEEFRAYE